MRANGPSKTLPLRAHRVLHTVCKLARSRFAFDQTVHRRSPRALPDTCRTPSEHLLHEIGANAPRKRAALDRRKPPSSNRLDGGQRRADALMSPSAAAGSRPISTRCATRSTSPSSTSGRRASASASGAPLRPDRVRHRHDAPPRCGQWDSGNKWRHPSPSRRRPPSTTSPPPAKVHVPTAERLVRPTAVASCSVVVMMPLTSAIARPTAIASCVPEPSPLWRGSARSTCTCRALFRL